MPNPISKTAASIATGRTLYKDRCEDCHGRKGRGDGSSGTDLERKPTDLTAARVAEQTDGALFWKITHGRRPMPGYERKLSEEQRWHLINYLRSVSPNSKQKPGAEK